MTIVVRNDATPEELAALLVALLGVARAGVVPARRRSVWAAGPPWRRESDAWRRSFLPS